MVQVVEYLSSKLKALKFQPQYQKRPRELGVGGRPGRRRGKERKGKGRKGNWWQGSSGRLSV
jgi:hypothetical protein